MRNVFRLAPFLLLIALWGCGQDGGGGSNAGAPEITSFTANPATIAASGTAVELNWTITGTATSLTIDNGVGEVTGNTATVYPAGTTTYTLEASNSSGSDTLTTTVSVGGTGAGGEPTGTFGGSLSETGPFLNDAGGGISDISDSRIVRADPNTTIYFQASYSDTDGITQVVPYLANDNVDTDLTPGTSVYGFTSAGPTGCTLDGTQTAVTCTFAIAVGDIPNITGVGDFEGEFAYVFKVNVTDGAGTVTSNSSRAYVTIGVEDVPIDETDPADPTDATDPTDPSDPTDVSDPTDPTDPTDSTDPGPSENTLTATAPSNGTITSSIGGINCGTTCTADIASTTTVVLTANAANGYDFASWTGDCAGTTTATCNLAMSEDRNVGATFVAETSEPETNTLMVSEPNNGSISSSPAGIDCGSDCEGDFLSTATVALTATSATGYTFGAWTGACENNTTNSCSLVMSEDRSAGATFVAESTAP